jgi:uncharacterized cupredoxin-like copper-binding protein
MRNLVPRFPALALVPAMLLAAFAGAAAANPSAAPAIRVTLGKPGEFAITPSVATARAGKATFVITNRGTITHEVNVIRVAGPTVVLPRGRTPGQVLERGKIAAAEGLRAGRHTSLSVVLKPGRYQLFCNIPGHYMSGMRTTITVT